MMNGNAAVMHYRIVPMSVFDSSLWPSKTLNGNVFELSTVRCQCLCASVFIYMFFNIQYCAILFVGCRKYAVHIKKTYTHCYAAKRHQMFIVLIE